MTAILLDPEREQPPSESFRFASAVAEFGMVLRNSEHQGSSSASRVAVRADGALGNDRDGYRAEFVELVQRYRQIAVVSDRE